MLSRITIIILTALLSINTGHSADATCNGRFPNPITDYCWSCVFPMTIANQKVMINSQEDVDTINSSNPFCFCENPPKIGLLTGFWEPSRMVEVVRTPYCFVSLNGTKLDVGIHAPSHAQPRTGGPTPSAFYNVHWYMNPLFYWLEVLMDDACLEKGVFDLAYLTELDPLWSDSTLSFVINPDVVLFSNFVAQAACAADCISASIGFPEKELYWCAGCQGSLYPLSGWVNARVSPIQASSLLMQRLTAKMHRELLMWAASGRDGQCGYYPQPLMDKTNYKYSMVYPVPQTQKISGRCCQPFGRTSVVWGAGKSFPVKGEDFVYQIFRKRNCCTGNLLN